MSYKTPTQQLNGEVSQCINYMKSIVEDISTYRDSEKKENILDACEYVISSLNKINNNTHNGSIIYNPCKGCTCRICSSCMHNR